MYIRCSVEIMMIEKRWDKRDQMRRDNAKLGEITVWWLVYRLWNSKGALWSGLHCTVLRIQIYFFARGLYSKRSDCSWFIMRRMTTMWRLWTQQIIVQFWLDYFAWKLTVVAFSRYKKTSLISDVHLEVLVCMAVCIYTAQSVLWSKSVCI